MIPVFPWLIARSINVYQAIRENIANSDRFNLTVLLSISFERPMNPIPASLSSRERTAALPYSEAHNQLRALVDFFGDEDEDPSPQTKRT